MSGNGEFASFALSFSHRGRRRRNEDSVGSVELPGGSRFVVLCDGMGGHAGGDFASRAAVEGVLTRVVDGLDPVDAIEEVNGELHEIASEDPMRRGMGTTLVALLLQGTSAMVYNVGDSRAYRLSPEGAAQQITRDHSFAADSAATGDRDGGAVLDSRYRNALTRAVATDAGIEVDVFGPVDLADGSMLLLCSDGLYKALPDDRLAICCRVAPAVLPNGMTQAVLEAFDRGSDDNISLAVVGLGQVRARVSGRLAGDLGRALDRRLTREERLARRAARRAAGGASVGRSARLLLAMALAAVGAGTLIATFGAPRPAATAPAEGPSTRSAPTADDEATRPSLGDLLNVAAPRSAETAGDQSATAPTQAPPSAGSAGLGTEVPPSPQAPLSPTADTTAPGARPVTKDPKCKDATKC